mgnify:CR=1 FL=1
MNLTAVFSFVRRDSSNSEINVEQIGLDSSTIRPVLWVVRPVLRVVRPAVRVVRPAVRVVRPVVRVVRPVVRVVRSFYVHLSSECSESRLSLDVRL